LASNITGTFTTTLKLKLQQTIEVKDNFTSTLIPWKSQIGTSQRSQIDQTYLEHGMNLPAGFETTFVGDASLNNSFRLSNLASAFVLYSNRKGTGKNEVSAL
jgi:hypothetical protein